MSDIGKDDKPVLLEDPFGNPVTVMLSSLELWVDRKDYKKVNGEIYSLAPDAKPYTGNKGSKELKNQAPVNENPS